MAQAVVAVAVEPNQVVIRGLAGALAHLDKAQAVRAEAVKGATAVEGLMLATVIPLLMSGVAVQEVGQLLTIPVLCVFYGPVTPVLTHQQILGIYNEPIYSFGEWAAV
jgi:hypothetical protein